MTLLPYPVGFTDFSIPVHPAVYDRDNFVTYRDSCGFCGFEFFNGRCHVFSSAPAHSGQLFSSAR